MQHPRNDPDKYQEYVKILFKELGKLITFLSESSITAGYNGIRDFLTPLYYDFFRSEDVYDTTRLDVQE